MTNAASLAYAEGYAAEDALAAEARQRAEVVGVAPVGPACASVLGFLTAAIGARAVVEIGTGTGVSGLCLLRASKEVVLTSVDREAEHQRHAREVFTVAGIAPQRFRLIAGSALDVMSRLADGGYDLVFLDGDKVEYGEYLDEALRLVRPGGLICFDNALWHDRVADPDQNDPETAAIRDLLQRVQGDETLHAIVLPVGDGLLVIRSAA
ncbi:MAG: O-methyltransferase [Aeromicrobium sp.]|uniref:O-methyltransferase n=1 Tax=Aeromicrobium sp. TaxID=1871063 RepID=UPI0039E4F860